MDIPTYSEVTAAIEWDNYTPLFGLYAQDDAPITAIVISHFDVVIYNKYNKAKNLLTSSQMEDFLRSLYDSVHRWLVQTRNRAVRRTLLYLAIGLDCDMPILEAVLYCGTPLRRPDMSPRFNVRMRSTFRSLKIICSTALFQGAAGAVAGQPVKPFSDFGELVEKFIEQLAAARD